MMLPLPNMHEPLLKVHTCKVKTVPGDIVIKQLSLISYVTKMQ